MGCAAPQLLAAVLKNRFGAPTLGSAPVCGVFPEDSRQNNAHFFERLLAREPFCVHDW